MFKATFARTARQSIVIAAACIAATESTKAAQFNWNGGGGSLNTGWNADANWAGGIKPVSADDSVVDAAALVAVGVGAARLVKRSSRRTARPSTTISAVPRQDR